MTDPVKTHEFRVLVGGNVFAGSSGHDREAVLNIARGYAAGYLDESDDIVIQVKSGDRWRKVEKVEKDG